MDKNRTFLEEAIQGIFEDKDKDKVEKLNEKALTDILDKISFDIIENQIYNAIDKYCKNKKISIDNSTRRGTAIAIANKIATEIYRKYGQNK